LYILLIDQEINSSLTDFFKKHNFEKIITNNKKTTLKLKNIDVTSIPIDDIFSDISSETYDVHSKVSFALENYSKEFRSITFNKIKIFTMIQQDVLLQLSLFYKLENIFNKSRGTIFVTDTDSTVFQSIKIFFENQKLFLKLCKFTNDQIEEISQIQKINFLKKNLFCYFPFKKYLLKKYLNKIKNETKKLYSTMNFSVMFFFSSSSDYVLEPYLPILKNTKIPHVFGTFVFDSFTSNFFNIHNIPTINLQRNISIISRMIKNFSESTVLLKKIQKIDSSKDILFLKNNDNLIYISIFRKLATYYIAEYLLSEFKPNSTVQDESGIGNSIILAGKNLNIKSFSIRTLFLTNDPLVKHTFKADKICLYGRQGYDVLLQQGYDSNQLIITGNPKYDYLNSVNFADEKQKLEKICKFNGKKLIVIGQGRWLDSDEKWMPDFIKFCNKHDFDLIIKVHPIYKTTFQDIHQQKIEFFKTKCQNMKYLITIDLDRKMLISAADLIISDHSNFGVESVLMNKSIISTNFEHEDIQNNKNVYDYDVGYFAENYEDLEKYALEIFKNNNIPQKIVQSRKTYFDKWNFQNDGKSLDRILNLLVEKNLD
jgi:hypothetical protein